MLHEEGWSTMTDWPAFFSDHLRTDEESLAKSQNDARALIQNLDTEETHVLTRLVTGWGGRAIAAELGISLIEFEARKRQLQSKLNARSTSDLVRIGIYADLDP